MYAFDSFFYKKPIIKTFLPYKKQPQKSFFSGCFRYDFQLFILVLPFVMNSLGKSEFVFYDYFRSVVQNRFSAEFPEYLVRYHTEYF